MTMKFNLVLLLTMGLLVLWTFAAPEKSRSEIFDDADLFEEVHDTKIEFSEISAIIRNELESVETFIEENENFKVETAETTEPEFEAVEKIIEPELKVEDETFELGKFKAERVKRAEHESYGSRILSSLSNGDYWRHPISKYLKRLLPKICDWTTLWSMLRQDLKKSK